MHISEEGEGFLMLMAIFDPEVLNQFNGLWENYSEFKKENPEALTVVMWVFGFVLWGGVLFFRSSRQPIVWSEFGKLLFQALQHTANNWKWKTQNKNGITCETNSQRIACDSCGDFTINDKSITEYLSRKERKELKKLKNNIVLALKAKDKEEEERREEARKKNLLNQLAKAQGNEPVKDEPVNTKRTFSVDVGNLTSSQVKEVIDRWQKDKSVSQVESKKPEVMKTTSGHFITMTDHPEPVKPMYATSAIPEAIKPKEEVKPKEPELTEVEKTILADLMQTSIWRWGTDGKGLPTGNSVRTTRIIYNFKNKAYFVDGKEVKVSLIAFAIFERLANGIISSLRIKQPI
jgi:hypothetical protein